MMLQMFSNPRVKLETITSEDMPDEVNKCGLLTIYLLNGHEMDTITESAEDQKF